MPGSARSLVSVHFSGLRVGGTDYYPAHSKNGVNISQRLVIDAYANSVKRNGDEIRDRYQLTVWGKLADICAKAMSQGKEFHATCKPRMYEGRVFIDRQPLVLHDGTVVKTNRYSFTIVDLIFGEESQKLIDSEIQKGIRPADWNKTAEGRAAWKQLLQMRMAVQFDPSKPAFGYARVRKPEGEGIGAYIPNQPAGGSATPAPSTIAKDLFQATVNPAGGAQAAPATAGQTNAQAPADPFGMTLGY